MNPDIDLMPEDGVSDELKMLVSTDDYKLLQAVKVFLEYSHIKVPNGDNNRMEISSNGGYSYTVTAERIIHYANARNRELVKYRTALSEELHQTQAIIDQLPTASE